MIKQYQISQNDCFSACLASILHIPLESVPYFHRISGNRTGNKKLTTERFYTEIDKWLSSFDLKLQYHSFNRLKNIPSYKYFIGCDKNHAFVCKDNKVVLDPNPTEHICDCYSTRWNLRACVCRTHYGSQVFGGRFITGILYGFDLIKRTSIRPKRKVSRCNFGNIKSFPHSNYNEKTRRILLYS